MSKMTPAFFAQYFGSAHPEARVFPCFNSVDCGRIYEARPSRTGIKFLVGLEKKSAAAGAQVHAFLVIVKIFSSKRPFG